MTLPRRAACLALPCGRREDRLRARGPAGRQSGAQCQERLTLLASWQSKGAPSGLACHTAEGRILFLPAKRAIGGPRHWHHHGGRRADRRERRALSDCPPRRGPAGSRARRAPNASTPIWRRQAGRGLQGGQRLGAGQPEVLCIQKSEEAINCAYRHLPGMLQKLETLTYTLERSSTLSGASKSIMQALSRLRDCYDRNLLHRLARARKRRDRFLTQSALHALLASYQPRVHALVRHRLGASLVYEHDVDEVIAMTMERLVRALHAKDDFGGVPFGAVVARNVDWAIIEFWRRRSARTTIEALMAPSDLPESIRLSPLNFIRWPRRSRISPIETGR
jgi:hypothetical protein